MKNGIIFLQSCIIVLLIITIYTTHKQSDYHTRLIELQYEIGYNYDSAKLIADVEFGKRKANDMYLALMED